jgi:hypothetical protein
MARKNKIDLNDAEVIEEFKTNSAAEPRGYQKNEGGQETTH